MEEWHEETQGEVRTAYYRVMFSQTLANKASDAAKRNPAASRAGLGVRGRRSVQAISRAGVETTGQQQSMLTTGTSDTTGTDSHGTYNTPDEILARTQNVDSPGGNSKPGEICGWCARLYD